MVEEREVRPVVATARAAHLNSLHRYNGSGCDFMTLERSNWLKKKNLPPILVQSTDHGKSHHGKPFSSIESISVNM